MQRCCWNRFPDLAQRMAGLLTRQIRLPRIPGLTTATANRPFGKQKTQRATLWPPRAREGFKAMGCSVPGIKLGTLFGLGIPQRAVVSLAACTRVGPSPTTASVSHPRNANNVVTGALDPITKIPEYSVRRRAGSGYRVVTSTELRVACTCSVGVSVLEDATGFAVRR